MRTEKKQTIRLPEQERSRTEQLSASLLLKLVSFYIFLTHFCLSR